MRKNTSRLQDKQEKANTPRVPRQRNNRNAKRTENRKQKKISDALGIRGQLAVDLDKLPNVLDQTNIQIVNRSLLLDRIAVERFALAIVNAGLKKGFSPNQAGSLTTPNGYAQTIGYIEDNIIKAISGQALEGLAQPKFMWEIQTALATKKVPFKTGFIQYQPSVLELGNVGGLYQYGADGSGRQFFMAYGMPTTTPVNGLPILDTAAEVAYSREASSQLVQTLWNLFNTNDRNQGLSEVVALQDYTPFMSKDPSAYASVFPERAVAFDTAGGIRTTVANEVRIRCPIFSKFLNDAAGSEEITNRGVFQYHPSAGSSSYLAVKLTETKHPKQLTNKAVPMFKFYEFDEIFESLAFWIGEVQSVNSSTLVGSAIVEPYPLTAWQFAYILRQSLMTIFSNEMGPDLTTFESPTLEERPWIVFSPAMNGRQTAKVFPKIPCFHSENISSIRRSIVELRPNYCIEWIPLLGTKYTQKDYTNVNYVWNDSTGAEFPVFSTLPGEANVNLIDYSVSIDNSIAYLYPDCETYAELCNSHNDWVVKRSNASTTLYDLGRAEGVQIFLNNMKTRIQQQEVTTNPVTSPVPQLQKRPSKQKVYGATLAQKKMRGVKPPDGVVTDSQQLTVATLTGVNPFMSDLSEFDQSLWLPSFVVNPTSTPGLDAPAYQAFMMEPHAVPLGFTTAALPFSTVGVTQQTLYEVNKRRALMDVRQVLSSPTSIEETFTRLREKGQGSFLSLLSSMIAPALGGLAKALGA